MMTMMFQNSFSRSRRVVSCSLSVPAPPRDTNRLPPSRHLLVRHKFGRNVLHVNTHRLMESDFRFDVIISKRWSWHVSCTKVLPPGEFKTKRLPREYAAKPVSS